MTTVPDHGNSTRIWNISKIILALILVGFVISRTDLDELSALTGHISFLWLGLSVFLLILLTMLKALQYYILIGRNISYFQSLNVVVLQNAISNYFASSAGIVSYLAVLRGEHGVKLSRSAGMFVLIKFGDLVAIWLALIFSSALVWEEIGIFRSVMVWLQAGIGCCVIIILLVILLRQKFISFLERFLDWSRLSRISFVQKAIGAIQSISEIDPERMLRILLLILLSSITYFVLTIIYIYVNYQVFEFTQPFTAVLFVSTLLQLVSYIPIQIFGGLGVTETSALYFWSPFNVQQTALASVLIGMRILAYLINLLPLLYLPIYTLFLRPKDNPSS